jgi:hypothetical protein
MKQRFSLEEKGQIADRLNPASNGSGHYFEGDPVDDMHLRECVLRRRLSHLIDGLIVNNNPMKKFSTGETYQPHCEESFSVWWAIFQAIKASHLNTLDVVLSLQHRFSGALKREKQGWQDYTSLSLSIDDVERLLRDLYGEADERAIDQLRYAVFVIVEEFTKYLRTEAGASQRSSGRLCVRNWCSRGIRN